MTEAKVRSKPRKARNRGRGEGSIAQRSDGLWVGTVMLGRKPNGRPDRPKVYGHTRAEVQTKIDELRRRHSDGNLVDSAKERETVAAYLEQWLEASRMSVRPRTWERYEQLVRVHVAPAIGHIKLRDLRPNVLQRLYASRLSAGLAPRTVLKLHVLLHRALKMAVRWGYISRNVTEAVDPPATARPDIRPPDPVDLARLIDSASSSRDRLAALWTVAVYSGCRQGELLGLAWSDVNLDAATLTIRRALVLVKDQVPVFGDPKSRTSRRTISVPPEAVTALRFLKVRQAAERLAAAEWADYGLVFTSHFGTPLIARNVTRDFKLALGRAGLPQTIRFHDLRHAHATLLLRAGVPLKVASGRLGHNSIAITGDLYQHLVAEMDVDAAARAQRAIRG